jgi:enoyl-CoA hydratase
LTELVTLDLVESVAVVTLDRPEARNALNRTMLTVLPQILADAERRDDVAVVVLTGTDPAFCDELDLSERSTPGGLDLGKLTAAGRPWPDHRKPWIAAVNGVAITGGLELALACDFVVASERAAFADTHARVGILPFWGLTSALPQAVGLRAARLMSLTGNFVNAHEALQWGLVSKVVEHDELMPTVLSLARDVVSNDQAAARALMAGYNEAHGLPADQAVAGEHARALEWQGRGFGPDRVAARLDAVRQRGRAQR